MSALARAHGAVNLGQGFPDFGWPDDVIARAAEALTSGSNQYPPMRGLAELRDAVAAHYRRHQGVDIDAGWVTVTSGATEALAASLIADPEVIFLDEPSTGLDPASRLGLWRMVRDQVASGVTVLLTTQYLEEADQLADQIAVIDSGQVIANGTPDDLKRKVGLEHLEVGLASPDELPALLRALSEVAGGEPAVGENGRSVSVPLIDGMEAIAAVATVLHAEGIAVQDFALRRPSLDDVFLTLTGRSAATAVPDTPNSGGSKEGTAAS